MHAVYSHPPYYLIWSYPNRTIAHRNTRFRGIPMNGSSDRICSVPAGTGRNLWKLAAGYGYWISALNSWHFPARNGEFPEGFHRKSTEYCFRNHPSGYMYASRFKRWWYFFFIKLLLLYSFCLWLFISYEYTGTVEENKTQFFSYFLV